jgi:hypothetical protein
VVSKEIRKRWLTIEEILVWAREYRLATGKWPTKDSGGIAGAKFETWIAVDSALRQGLRGLPGGSSLAQLLAEKEGARNIGHLAPLTEDLILAWVDAYKARTGSWPTKQSGPIPESAGDKWQAIDRSLRHGLRGLAPGSSLARLLALHRGVRNRKQLCRLREEDILKWANAYHDRVGTWPKRTSGQIVGAPGENWKAVDNALRQGLRGLPGGSSLAALLADQCGVRYNWSLPNLTIDQILRWAQEHHQRTESWPKPHSGPIPGTDGETWEAVDRALRKNSRGLSCGCSLAKLLATKYGLRNRASIPKLTRKMILGWADAHRRQTGDWPTKDSGAVVNNPEETWLAVDAALRYGGSGLRGGSSLARLLAKYRGRWNCHGQPRLSQKKILAWADAHFSRTGHWPNTTSGPVIDSPGETWDMIDNALRQGDRMLRGGSSLLQLLVKKRGVRNIANLPPFAREQVLSWAQKHLERTGSWPTYKCGAILEAPDETWSAVDSALRYGTRGFAGGSSLAKLLDEHRKGMNVPA